MTYDKRKGMVDLLRSLAEEGDPTKRTEREALGLILETVTRMEARQADFLSRLDVYLSQASGRASR